mmetsp:Transcript_23440/g.32757  ORF Transcript_23440/g.32757 Transcript_23440/m.32757 type:complete len:229 (+) Transcript_23440:344-1030(+)
MSSLACSCATLRAFLGEKPSSQALSLPPTMKPVRVGKINPKSTALLVCDVQERFRDLIKFMPSVIHTSKILMKSADVMKIPTIVTEQYPKALGRTVPELELAKFPNVKVIEKKQFSMVTPEVENWLATVKPESVILVGIEAHVCVLQTALDLVARGIEVHLAADGVSSRFHDDRAMAFERMKQIGVWISTSESIIFQAMQSADYHAFRDISSIFKEQRPDSGIVLSKL